MDKFLQLAAPRKVLVTRLGVALFNAHWPASRLQSSRHYWFEFDHDGNLVDTDVPEHSAGTEADALSDDCLEWLENDTTPEWLEGLA